MKKLAVFVIFVAIAIVGGYFSYEKFQEYLLIEALTPQVKSVSLRLTNAMHFETEESKITYKEVFEKLEADITEINKNILGIQSISTPNNNTITAPVVAYSQGCLDILKILISKNKKKLELINAIDKFEVAVSTYARIKTLKTKGKIPIKDRDVDYDFLYLVAPKKEIMDKASNEFEVVKSELVSAIVKIEGLSTITAQVMPIHSLIDNAILKTRIDLSQPKKELPNTAAKQTQDMKFVFIKPGTFTMGSPSGELGRDDDETQHQVTITRGFYMQTTEVTQSQWQSVMGSNPSDFSGCGDCPVEKVSWEDIHDFLGRLNSKGGVRYRLPTEAEWEYACRAGSIGAIYGNLDSIAWHRGNSESQPHPVGQKQANAWGLYDMIGNVLEWCADWKGNYPTGSVTDPRGPSGGSIRVFRGGGWNFDQGYCRSAWRGGVRAFLSGSDGGFRLARDN